VDLYVHSPYTPSSRVSGHCYLCNSKTYITEPTWKELCHCSKTSLSLNFTVKNDVHLPLIKAYSLPLWKLTMTVTSVWTMAYTLACVKTSGPLRVHGQILRFQLLNFEPKDARNFINIAIILQHNSSYMFLASLAHHQGAHSCTKQLLKISSCSRAAGNSSVCDFIVNLIKPCALFSSNSSNWIVMRGMENVKLRFPLRLLTPNLFIKFLASVFLNRSWFRNVRHDSADTRFMRKLWLHDSELPSHILIYSLALNYSEKCLVIYEKSALATCSVWSWH